MEFEEFQANCYKGKCLRRKKIDDKCQKFSKQHGCFIKWNRIDSKEMSHDYEWDEIQREVWMRDAGYFPGKGNLKLAGEDWKKHCRLWKTLTLDERILVRETFADLLWINRSLDCAHAIPKSVDPTLYYDINNVFLIGRFFHSRLDQYKDPVTAITISKERRAKWFLRIRNGAINNVNSRN